MDKDLERFQDAISTGVNDFVYGWKPDWEALYTKEEIAQELDIEYTTFGWYRAKSDTETDMLLILPVNWPENENQHYRVFVYNNRDPRDIFKRIGGMFAVGTKKD